MKVYLYYIGKPKDAHANALASEYIRRAGHYAASMMAEIRTALRAYAIQHAKLDQVMTLLNALVLAIGGGRSATVAMLSLELETQELCAVSAGHPPPVLLHPDGRTELSNLFICGTDQGLLGIVGAMLGGITIANAHILRKSAASRPS